MEYFHEEDLRLQTLTTTEERNEAFRLRYQVFAEELKWVPGNESNQEIDSYDSKCVQVGVLAKSRLIACLRIHFSTDQFMIENEFKEIIGNHKIQKTPQTIEVTRFCIANDLRKSQVSTKYGMFPIVMALEKAFYNWCRSNDKDIVYMVVSNHFFRLLNLLGMPCTAVAPAVTMPDGVIAIAAISSWTAFEKFTETKKPTLLTWFKDWKQSHIEEMVI